jgi:flagellar biosynthesis protein FlhF
VATALSSFWKKPVYRPGPTLWHAFIGPSGSGKTTCLCKWLAQTVLLAGCSARVWRLDGARANTAEALSVYAEVLGVPVSRSWPGDPRNPPAQVHFVDWPGFDWRDTAALEAHAQRLEQMPALQFHLVLNGAYEVSLLLEQVRAFSSLPVGDLIFTHLDEETRWGKLWNFVLGTNFAISFLSAGQNVPGDFRAASPADLLPRCGKRVG